jgi:hypothetical protein
MRLPCMPELELRSILDVAMGPAAEVDFSSIR